MKRILLAAFFTCILFSCKKENKPVEEAEVPEVTTGNLSGYVNQYNQFGVAYTTGLNTTTVSIDSTDAVCFTDQNGHYSFPNISTGIYTLIYKKPGCGSVQMQDINYKFNDTVTYNAKIADIPSFSISSAYVKDTSWFNATLSGIYYNANSAPKNNKATAVAIVGKSSNISLLDPASYINQAPASLLSTLDYNRFLSYSFLSQTYKFKKDSIIFVKIYPVSTLGGAYYDNDLKKTVYTAYGNPTAVFTVVMPQ